MKNEELFALMGDLVSERKRLSESLRRLESTLLHGQAAKELYKKLGGQSVEGLHVELELLARSLDRIGALTKTLVHQVNTDRLVSAEPLLLEAALAIEREAGRHGHVVSVHRTATELKVDRELAEKFRPVFLEMLGNLVEYCVEGAKERAARKKRPKANFQIELKPTELGQRLMVVCDGNGILPPMAGDHGIRLAALGVRASFEGKPGHWSAWIFHLPKGSGASHYVPVRVDGRKLCLPAFCVAKVSASAPDPQRRALNCFSLGEGMSRLSVKPGEEARAGKMALEIAVGTDSVSLIVDEVLEADEFFMKPLHSMFSGNGRFLGVIVTDVPGPEGRSELTLVLNPAHLVYGDDALLHQSHPSDDGGKNAS